MGDMLLNWKPQQIWTQYKCLSMPIFKVIHFYQTTISVKQAALMSLCYCICPLIWWFTDVNLSVYSFMVVLIAPYLPKLEHTKDGKKHGLEDVTAAFSDPSMYIITRFCYCWVAFRHILYAWIPWFKIMLMKCVGKRVFFSHRLNKNGKHIIQSHVYIYSLNLWCICNNSWHCDFIEYSTTNSCCMTI